MVLKEYLKTLTKLLLLLLLFVLLALFFRFVFFYYLAFLFFLLSIFSLYFFRNPVRQISLDDNNILAPSDGKVLEIKKEFNELIGSDVYVIRIFMSVFNVHVQRAPISGVIKNVFYQEGKFLPATNKLACIKNEQNTILFEKDDKRVICKQIAGLIARSIVFFRKKDDFVKIGDIFGMIKFGSQVDIYIPDTVKLNVVKGQSIIAGETVIANWF